MFLKKLHTSSNSVEIKSAPMFACLSLCPTRFAPLAAWPPGLTFLNNKNGWNTFMCSSSTSMISDLSSADYPPKKWNTPVPLFPQNQSTFPRNYQLFNILLTNSLLMFFRSYVYLSLYPTRFAPLAVRPPDCSYVFSTTRRALRLWPSGLRT